MLVPDLYVFIFDILGKSRSIGPASAPRREPKRFPRGGRWARAAHENLIEKLIGPANLYFFGEL